MGQMTRTERLLRLARLRGDRAAELILTPSAGHAYIDASGRCAYRVNGRFPECGQWRTNDVHWTEAELRAAWGDR